MYLSFHSSRVLSCFVRVRGRCVHSSEARVRCSLAPETLATSHNDSVQHKPHTDLQLGREVHHGSSSFSSLVAAVVGHALWQRQLLWALDLLGVRSRGISTEARSLLEPVLVPPHLGRRPRARAAVRSCPACYMRCESRP